MKQIHKLMISSKGPNSLDNIYHGKEWLTLNKAIFFTINTNLPYYTNYTNTYYANNMYL